MNRMLVIAAIIVALGPLAVGQTKSARRTQTETVVEGIRRLDQERIQAQIHADAAALDRIYADDFIGIGPSGTVRTKPQVLADFTSHDLKFQSITTDEVRSKLREHGIEDIGQVRLASLEPDGELAVRKSDADEIKARTPRKPLA